MTSLTHLNEKGEARMVDVSDKAVTSRSATAEGSILMRAGLLDMIETGTAKKGDALAVARVAGILAAKRTHELIPLCHPLALAKVTIDFSRLDEPTGLRVTANVKVSGQTGVEMEALTAVSVACLTVYDMLKAVDKGMVITGVRLLEKSGGRSGDWQAGETGGG